VSNQYTPGEWSLSGIPGDNHIKARVDGRSQIVCIVTGWPQLRDADLEANKLLIAAAPDLIAACKEVVSMLTSPKFVQWKTSNCKSDNEWAMVSAMESRLAECRKAIKSTEGQ
jgi:hypothetical protein